MAEKDEREDAAKADAELKNTILDALGKFNARLDALEAAEKSKRDAEEEERKADKARRDAEKEERKELKAKIDALEKELPKSMKEADAEEMADAQAKADSIFQAFGDSAPIPMRNETVPAYRRRVANKLKAHSPGAKDANLMAIHDEVAFSVIEKQIYADALTAANSPAVLPPGQLRMRTRNEHGHVINTFDGTPSAWMDGFAGPQRQFVTEFLGV